MALSKIQDEMLALSGNACKAWVNFNGTGTVAIRDSYNVSSITDNGTGDYTVNFTDAMSDANYSCLATTTNGLYATDYGAANHLAASVRVVTRSDGGIVTDADTVDVAIFGN